MMFYKCLIGLSLILALGSCSKSLSPEQQAQVNLLTHELSATDAALSSAVATDAQYSGGAVKALTTLRVQLLQINKALLQQRISAIESGAPMTVKVNTSKPDTERADLLASEIAAQETRAAAAQVKADSAGGGLIGAMAQMETATEQNTLALLRQQYLIAKYGLAPLTVAPRDDGRAQARGQAALTTTSEAETSDNDKIQFEIIKPVLLSKRFATQDYQDYIWFNIQFDPIGLDKPTRAIKGALILTDLFGEQKFALNWTIDKPMKPGETYTENGSGFDYNKFVDSHQWVLATDLKNMRAKFRVDSILYADDTRRDF